VSLKRRGTSEEVRFEPQITKQLLQQGLLIWTMGMGSSASVVALGFCRDVAVMLPQHICYAEACGREVLGIYHS